MKPADWIIGHDATQGDLAYAMECKRCGTIQKVATPINVGCYVAMAKVFGKQHRKCRRRPEAAEPKGGTPDAT